MNLDKEKMQSDVLDLLADPMNQDIREGDLSVSLDVAVIEAEGRRYAIVDDGASRCIIREFDLDVDDTLQMLQGDMQYTIWCTRTPATVSDDDLSDAVLAAAREELGIEDDDQVCFTG